MEKEGFIAKYAKALVAMAVLFGAMSGSLGALISASPMVIGFWRLTIALPFFLIPAFKSRQNREELVSISRKDFFLCLVAGVCLFGHFFSWFSAVKLTNVSSAAVLASLHPLVVLFITLVIYKKKVGWKSILAMVVALIGGAIIIGSDFKVFAGNHMEGNLFSLGAATFMGIYFAIGEKVRTTVKGVNYVLIVFFSCWVCFSAGVLFTKTSVIGYETVDYILMIAMAFVCQIGSHAVWNLCLGNVSSLYVSTWEAGDPAFSTLIAMVLVGQIPTFFEVIGCTIVVGALLFYNKFERETNV